MSNLSIRQYMNQPLSERVKDRYCNFFDWFCKNESLANKQIALDKKLKQIAESDKINIDTMGAIYKNNCPAVGSLYDDFRIIDVETGNVIYNIIPRSGHKCHGAKPALVYGAENNFTQPLVEGDWRAVKKFFGV